MSGLAPEAQACAFTGHRPARFHFQYQELHPDAIHLRELLHREIVRLAQQGVTTFYSGMAQGVDQWAAEQVLSLRELGYFPLRLIAVLPCREQDRGWPPQLREHYLDLLLRADEVVRTADTYSPGCMQLRNRYLVDRAATLLAVYDGSAEGGTAYTVQYAKKRSRRILCIHPDTMELSELPQQLRLFE